jgi:hypothetical protein
LFVGVDMSNAPSIPTETIGVVAAVVGAAAGIGSGSETGSSCCSGGSVVEDSDKLDDSGYAWSLDAGGSEGP